MIHKMGLGSSFYSLSNYNLSGCPLHRKRLKSIIDSHHQIETRPDTGYTVVKKK